MKELDQDAVNLAKSIRQVESNGRFDAKGKSGEYGAYQYTTATWASSSAKYLGRQVPLETATPQEQNEVAYKQIKEWKDKGFNPGQIASMWNAGSGKPNAYLEGNKGVNQFGVEYDTQAYATKVAQEYQKMKGQQPTQTVSQETSQASHVVEQPKEDKSFLRKAAKFAFPILEEKERTPLQTVGDIGLSALWFIPGVGQGAKALTTATKGLAPRVLGQIGTKVAGGALEGAGIGYTADVASGLSEGETIGEAVKPGMGTAIGGGIGGAVGKLAGRYSQGKVIERLGSQNNAVFGQTKRGANELAESFSKKKDPGTFLAERGINLTQHINPETIAYETKEVAEKLISDASALNKKLDQALTRIKDTVSVGDIEQKLLSKVPKNAPERVDIIRKEMSLLKQQFGDSVDATALNQWKERNWRLGKFDIAIPSDTRLTSRMIGNTLKGEVEQLAKKGGLKDVGKLNEMIGSYFDTADMLEMLNGTKAKGGRLGDIITKQTLQTVGGIGGFTGLGPIGAIAGVIIGNYGANVLNNLVRKLSGSPIDTAILNKIAKEEPELIKQFEAFARKNPKELEALKKQLAEKNIPILRAPRKTPTPQVLAPKEETGGLIPRIIKTGGGILGAQ